MYPRYVTVLGERRMRKEGTDVGWRLRADLHHGGDPSGLPFRVSPTALARVLWRSPSAKLRPRVGSAGRSRDRKSMRPARRSCGPIDFTVERDFVRVLVACGQGQPCVRRKSLVRAHKETRTAGVLRRTLVCGAGREEMPRRHPSHLPCHSATRKGNMRSPIRPRGFIRRAAVSVASDMNGQEGSRPQRWGTATDEEKTFEG
jgi:hypothetical protein